jgi:cytochrome c oxidase subunit 3
VHAPKLHEQYADLARQEHAARLGMWVFLGSETMLFAALFALYAAYRTMYPADFAAGVRRDDLVLGTVNLGVLLTTSFVAVLGLHAVGGARPLRAAWLFLFCAVGGAIFLGLKGLEYVEHLHEGLYPGSPTLAPGGATVFFTLYFALTGLHGLHLLVGIGLVLWAAAGCLRGRYPPSDRIRVENVVLYWHAVDVLWIFLWPLFYLARG